MWGIGLDSYQSWLSQAEANRQTAANRGPTLASCATLMAQKSQSRQQFLNSTFQRRSRLDHSVRYRPSSMRYTAKWLVEEAPHLTRSHAGGHPTIVSSCASDTSTLGLPGIA